MNKLPVIVIGIGEIGAVFARGLLRLGYPVYPVNRDTDMANLASRVGQAEMVLVAVGEKDLQPVLQQIPAEWQHCIALLQNELLPADYQQLDDPTVISVWFEKKKGQDSRVLIPSPATGPKAALLVEALNAVGIAGRTVDNADDMLFELMVKNLYILTTNIAGLRTGGDVGELWQQHETFARAVAADVIALQQALSGKSFDRESLIRSMLVAFDGDLKHKCMGRSAPARLARALQHAERLGLQVPTLQEIHHRDLPAHA